MSAGRCDQCKCAEAAYRNQLRRREREEVGLFAGSGTPDLSLVQGDNRDPCTSTNSHKSPANMLLAAVSAELEALGSHPRPGLAAAALAMARVLDNPRAVSTQPAATKVLASLLDKLRLAAAPGRRGHLAIVRTMTAKGGA
jgi:hypothetical protein